MPNYTRGIKRENLTFVLINDVFAYGWKTKDLASSVGVSAADLTTQLGHMDAVAAAAIANVVMVTGANSPKPGRVVKRIANATTTQAGSVGTFIAFDKLAAANAAGWGLSQRGRGVRLTANVPGRRSVTAVAELSNGLLYAFPLNKEDFDLVAVDLGLQSATQISDIEAKKLVSGSRSKPGVAAIDDDQGVLSTFFATGSREAALTAGFSIVKDEYVEYSTVAP
jgi:hypothetical protein